MYPLNILLPCGVFRKVFYEQNSEFNYRVMTLLIVAVDRYELLCGNAAIKKNQDWAERYLHSGKNVIRFTNYTHFCGLLNKNTKNHSTPQRKGSTEISGCYGIAEQMCVCMCVCFLNKQQQQQQHTQLTASTAVSIYYRSLWLNARVVLALVSQQGA